jgi:hypothetical protein
VEKNFPLTATKKKYSNSHVVRKKFSERNNKTITPSPLQVKWSVPKYFADISNIENEPNLPNEDLARDNICPELLITEQEVKDQLEILNNSKPSGPDGVAPRILRSVSQCLISPLTLLFNQLLQCGQLPYIWKRSHVTPVYTNKGTASDITNFRRHEVDSNSQF